MLIGRRAAHLVLQPNLAVKCFRFIPNQRERRGLMSGQIIAQLGQDGIEFALLVEPQANPRALLELEASCQFFDQRRKNHSNHLGDAQDAGALKRFNVHLDAVVNIGVPSLRPLCFSLPRRKDSEVL